jgi:hypothetical protein
MPWARATRATDAPSTKVSSTILRFSAMLRRCRFNATHESLSLGTTAACGEVSISTPSGHLSEVSTSPRMAHIYEDVETVTTVRLRCFEREKVSIGPHPYEEANNWFVRDPPKLDEYPDSVLSYSNGRNRRIGFGYHKNRRPRYRRFSSLRLPVLNISITSV